MDADQNEIARFSAQAKKWWDAEGPFAPLHRLNPLRLRYIREGITQPIQGLRVLDIGCGGGLLCEPMARLGARVTGLDASAETIKIAQHHAKAGQLDIDYRTGTISDLDDPHGEAFDVILNMEVVEHVSHVETFIAACAKHLKPGGMMFLSTINRTPEAFFLAIIAGEYIMRWLPIGTHQYHKFVTPDEIGQALKINDMNITDKTGMIYDPLMQSFYLSKNMRVNYMIRAVKK